MSISSPSLVHVPSYDRLSVVVGDITRLSVDAIVNAANEPLTGGGGVDGAIHHAAGPELLEYCMTLGGCPTGEARITPGFRLAARHIIHTVGPIWYGGESGEPELLAACYRACLSLARENGIRTIAFPAISTGAYGYPVTLATETAVAAVREMMARPTCVEHVCFCCFSEAVAEYYDTALTR